MDGMWKIFALAVFAALTAAILKKQSPEFALLLAFCAGIWVLGSIIGQISAQSMYWQRCMRYLPEGILKNLLKATGICILTKLTAETCRDCEQKALAASVELCGTVAGFTAALPLFAQVFAYIEAIL